MNMHLCRRMFASWLRKDGIQPEIVDLLQGRVSQSVLTRHYLTPDSTLSAKILDSLDRL
jgi:intergrase/recombinase